jgi:hypothetical protein
MLLIGCLQHRFSSFLVAILCQFPCSIHSSNSKACHSPHNYFHHIPSQFFNLPLLKPRSTQLSNATIVPFFPVCYFIILFHSSNLFNMYKLENTQREKRFNNDAIVLFHSPEQDFPSTKEREKVPI